MRLLDLIEEHSRKGALQVGLSIGTVGFLRRELPAGRDLAPVGV